jgi:hypothetical protein
VKILTIKYNTTPGLNLQAPLPETVRWFAAAHPLPTLAFLREMERCENANGQKFGQIRDPTRLLNVQQYLSDLQDHLI